MSTIVPLFTITLLNCPLLLGDIVVGIFVLLIGLGFGVVALGDFFLLVRVSYSLNVKKGRNACALLTLFLPQSLVKVSRLYRSTGASFSKAQAEFASGVMRNEHVRGAAADVVGSAVRAQLSNPSGGPRF